MPTESAGPGLPTASLLRRLASLVYESLLLAAVVLITGFLVAPLVSPRAATTTALQIPSALGRAVSLLGVVGATLAYCLLSWSAGRRTLPMKTWRLALRRRDGTLLDRRSALARYAACWIGPGLAVLAYGPLHSHGLGATALGLLALNYLWALVDRDRQFLHDRLAGTRIVADHSTTGMNPQARAGSDAAPG